MSVERRIRFSPQIPLDAPLVPDARPDAIVLAALARAAMPHLAPSFAWPDTAAIRREMAKEIPEYAGIERLVREGEFIQWGGPRLLGATPATGGR